MSLDRTVEYIVQIERPIPKHKIPMPSLTSNTLYK